MRARLLALLVSLTLAACGGGGSGSTPVAGVSSSPVVTVVTLSGVAATGGAIAGRIRLKDSAGHELVVDTTDGHFSFDVTSLSAPFMLQASWTVNGTTHTLYSLSTSTSGGTANITPLTHMAVVAAAGIETLDAVYGAGSTTQFSAIATAMPAAVAQVKQSLAPLLAQQGVATLDIVSGDFAPDHTGMDAVLDGVAITYQSGTVTVTDALSGAVLVDAPSTDLAHAMAVPAWTSQDAAVASDPDVAVSPSGNGLVVWSEMLNGHSVVRARVVSGSVGSSVTLSPSGDAGLPRVAFDASGNAVAVWTQYENARNDIWAARYTGASGTWSAAARVSSPNAAADANVPSIAVDASGNAIVVWHQGDGRVNHFDVWWSGYAAASSQWSVPVLVSDGVNSAYTPKVALDAAGDGIVAWVQQQGDGTTVSNGPQDIWGRSANTLGAWGAGARLNAVGGNVDWVYGQPAVAVDPNGNGFALWVQAANPLPFVIHAARFAAGSGWQASAVITNNVLDNCYGPQVAFDGSGNALAVWQQQTGGGAYGGVNRFDAVSGWGTSGSLGLDVPGDVYDPHVAVDGDGNATAVWYQWDMSVNAGGINVMSSRSLAGGAWSASRLMSPTNTDGGFTYPVPRVAANAAGQTLVVWGTNSN